MLKGAIHIHSTYSDGEFTLPELREVFLAEGCSFVCMTDHAEYFDDDRLQDYIAHCARLSDEKLKFAPGLEYTCEQGMHILGYGARTLAGITDPQKVISHIEADGAIPVIAHPKDASFDWIESFDVLPRGIETWNTKYDGRYAPRPGTFALLSRLQLRKRGMLAFFGQDLHWKKQSRALFVEVNAPTNEPSDIFAALARGDFQGRKGEWVLPSSGVVPEDVLVEFGRAHERSYRLWRTLKSAKSTLDRVGIRVPDSLKAQLRRIF